MGSIDSFPRGFIYSRRGIRPPEGYIPGPILSNFYVHPKTPLQYTDSADGYFVIVLGLIVPTFTDEQPERVSSELLERFRGGEAEFLSALDEYSGRYALIFGHHMDVRVVSDATAMRAVFYAKDGGVVASHALLVERALGGEIITSGLPFKYGFPGNHTPYARTRLLTANTLYEVRGGEVRRFWPVSSMPSRTTKSVARELLSRSGTALKNIARTRRIKVALTAGLDSRVLLAVALWAGVEFETYLYNLGTHTVRDRNVSVDLASAFGLRHTILPETPVDQNLQKQLDEAHYSLHHPKAVGELRAWINDPRAIAVTGHLLEIGGRNYLLTRRHRGKETPPPATPEAMAWLHYLTLGGPVKRQAEAWKDGGYFEESASRFQDFIVKSGFRRARDILDPFDQFYWEHRMSAWHGPAMVERDFYAEAFIPFNSRAIFTAMLGVPKQDRISGAVLYEVIRRVDKRLLSIPVNPDSWPPPVQ